MINDPILKQVLLLNEEKNFACVAQYLHLSQPALSRNIQVLEERLGRKLFDCVPGNLKSYMVAIMAVR